MLTNAGLAINELPYFIGTLRHPNYMSGTGAVLFAFFAAGFLFFRHSPNIKRLFLGMTILSVIMVSGSTSLSGVVTCIFVLVLLTGIVVGLKDKGKLIDLGKIMLVLSTAYILMTLYNHSFALELLESLDILIFSFISGIIFLGVYYFASYSQQISSKRIIIYTGVVFIMLLVSGISLGDKVQNKISQELEKIDSQKILQKLEKDKFDLPEYGVAWGSGRLYIWKETLQLSREKPLFGHGFDTFTFKFNQGDPAKMAALEDVKINVYKPHSIYLNMLYGAGFLGLLSYLAIILFVLFRSFRAIITKQENTFFLWPFVLGILAYLYQGIFNDPIHGLELMFWAFIGFAYVLSSDKNTFDNLAGNS